MNKPLSIKKEEFTHSLVDLINSCQLPACVVLDILQITTAQVSHIAEQQLLKDKELWKDTLLEQSKEE